MHAFLSFLEGFVTTLLTFGVDWNLQTRSGLFVRKWGRVDQFLDFDLRGFSADSKTTCLKNLKPIDMAGWAGLAKLETEDLWINRKRLSLHMPKPAHSNPDLSRI